MFLAKIRREISEYCSVPVSFSSKEAFSPCSAFRKVEKSFWAKSTERVN